MKQVLRRLLKRTVEGTTETNVFERIEKEVLTEQEIQELIDVFGDDPEGAYDVYGMIFDRDDDLVEVNLDALASGLADYLTEEDDNTILMAIKEKVAPLHQYQLSFEAIA